MRIKRNEYCTTETNSITIEYGDGDITNAYFFVMFFVDGQCFFRFKDEVKARNFDNYAQILNKATKEGYLDIDEEGMVESIV